MMRRWFALTVVLLGACASGKGAPNDAGQAIDGPVGTIDARPTSIDATPGKEVCNGQDDNHNQFVDEGTPEELCGVVANGTPICHGAAGCGIAMCNAGYVDLDMMFSTGCECMQGATENGSLNCDDGVDLGSIPDTNQAMNVVGNLTSGEDVDYYRFLAVDTPDTTCDQFHVRVQFLDNPSDQFQVDVMRGGCAGTGICSASTDVQWYTNFSMNGVSGECPCAPSPGNSNGVAVCTDDTSEFAVKVSRKPGFPITCENYTLEISNGKYPAP